MKTKHRDSIHGGIASMDLEQSDNKLYGKIGKLIKIIDDLRDLGLNEVFELPKICVLGNQSAGKSSVLESIIGLDCLPRGDGLVTRRPLELRLVHLPYNDKSEPWAEFEEIKGEKFKDFSKVKEKINDLTDKVAGKNSGIVDSPIRLRIYSNTCPDLTVIDLPGITRIPMYNTDQPKNIEEITKNMCEKYCQDKTTIILCVIPANIDLSTSEALSMSMRLDPEGNRTIGVLTKLDLMDHGTSAKKVLLNEEIPLKNGYIALKNRSQLDLTNKLPIEEAIKKEQVFFKNHSIYRNMSNYYFGIEYLVDKLRKLFFDHLKLYLPNIYTDLKEKIHDIQNQLDSLGTDYMAYSTYDNKMNLLNQLINKFGENIENIFAGKSQDLVENTVSQSIKLTYFEFLENISQGKMPSEVIDNDQIIKIVQISEGHELTGFPQANVINLLLEDYFEKIQEEQKGLYEKIYEFGASAIKKQLDKLFLRFPHLYAKLDEIVTEYIERQYSKTKDICDAITTMNFEYLYMDESSNIYEDTLRNLIVTNVNNKESKDKNVENYYNVSFYIYIYSNIIFF